MRIFEQNSLLIHGGRILDPYSRRDAVGDVAIVDGVISRDVPGPAPILDATGFLVCPGLMDMHVHLREPGQTEKETIETGTAAATAGGFTVVACMPNTQPPLDHPEVIRNVIRQARRADHCTVLPIAAITQGRSGQQLVDLAALRQAGAVAFSDDGVGVEDDCVMRAAFQQAKRHDVLLIQHCEYQAISAGGVMHAGATARRLGLRGLDPRSEEAMIERDLALCRETGGRYHVAHISTARAVDLVREAKAAGLPVTAEVCTHHLILTDEACAQADPNTKMHPPLRTWEDVQACRRGLLDGTIDCIVTDHAPHTTADKAVGFQQAPPGIVGLETALGLAVRAMILSELADWPDVISWFTRGPSNVLHLPSRAVQIGQPADLTLIDPRAQWTVDPRQFASKGQNTPLGGWTLTGKPLATVQGRRISLIGDIPLVTK